MKNLRTALIPVIAALAFIPALAAANQGDFSGGVAIGTGYAGVDTAPTSGLIVQGNVALEYRTRLILYTLLVQGRTQ